MNKQNRDARGTVAQNDENVIDCSFAELPPAPEPVDPPVIYIVQCADEPEGKIHAHGDFTVDGDESLVKTVKVTTPGGTATMNVRVRA